MHRSEEGQRRSISHALSVAGWATGISAGWAFFAFLKLDQLLHDLSSGSEPNTAGFSEVSHWRAFGALFLCAVLVLCAARLVTLLDGGARVLVAAGGFCAVAGLAGVGWDLAGRLPDETGARTAEILGALGTGFAPLLLGLAGLLRARARLWPAWLVAVPLIGSRAGFLLDWKLLRTSELIMAVHVSSALVAVLLAYSARRVKASPRPVLPVSLAADAVWLLSAMLICRALLFIAPGPISLLLGGNALSGMGLREWFLRADVAFDLGMAAALILLAVAVRKAQGNFTSAVIGAGICLGAALGEQLAAESQKIFVLDLLMPVHLSLKVELWLCGACDLAVLGLAPVFALHSVTQVWASEIEEVPTNVVWWLLAGGVAGLFRAPAALSGGVFSTAMEWLLVGLMVAGVWRFRRVVPALDKSWRAFTVTSNLEVPSGLLTAPAEEAARAARASPG